MDAGWAREVETIERGVWADMCAAPPQAFRDAIGLGQARFGAAIAVVASNVADTQFNRVWGFGVDRETSQQELDDAIAFMRASGAPRWWLQPATPETIAWTLARGFKRAPRPWAKMARGPAPPTRIDTSLSIDEIGQEGGEAFASIVCAAFGAPPSFGTWFRALIGRPRWRLYLARDGVTPVSAAAMCVDGDAAWLGIAATDPACRRRGGQGALMERRIDDAIAARCRIIVTEAGAKQHGTPSPSYDNMIRHGFIVVHDRPNFAPPEMT